MNIKVIIPIFFAILVGFLFGKVIFNNYDNNTVNAFNEGEKVYFIKACNFEKESDIKIDNINDYLVLLEDNVYNVYLGITKNKDNVVLIKNYFLDTFKNITVEEKYISNDIFISSLKEYDKVISIVNKKDDLLSILKIVNTAYEELVLDNVND